MKYTGSFGQFVCLELCRDVRNVSEIKNDAKVHMDDKPVDELVERQVNKDREYFIQKGFCVIDDLPDIAQDTQKTAKS